MHLHLVQCFLGLNYNRISISERLQLQNTEINPQDLKEVMSHLVLRLNTMQDLAVENRPRLQQKKHLFNEAVDSYNTLNQKSNFFSYTYPAMEESQSRGRLFHYRYPAIKPSIYSYLGNYLGFTGYYNPFTGEAQVNTTVPEFILPFTTCMKLATSSDCKRKRGKSCRISLRAFLKRSGIFIFRLFEMYSYSADTYTQ